MMPIECYKTYLAMKQHFTKDSYDYLKYCGRIKASPAAFNKRKDRYFFERMSRQKNDKEIEQFFVANFASCDDPQRLYMADIVKNGEKTFTAWQKRNQSLTYIFTNEVEDLFGDENFDEMFHIDGNRHPKILKEFLRGNVSIETLIILEKILGYKSRFDKKLTDPVWEVISYRISKYAPFLNIDVFRYKKILKETIL